MDPTLRIVQWLISDARILGDSRRIVAGYCERLCDAGVPLWRVRVGQRLANPLLSAWGVIWTPEGVEDYEVPRSLLETDAWRGSPFEYVTRERKPVRRALAGLESTAHATYRDLAAQGATDFIALPLVFGDGSVQGTSFATRAPQGFEDTHLEMLVATAPALAAAIEPAAMRRSLHSLLCTYLGARAGAKVYSGSIHLGEAHEIEAAVAIFDLRGFTTKATEWSSTQLLEHLGAYFKLVADAVEVHGGDVLKFMGDGVLAVFPTQDIADAHRASNAAIAAAMASLKQVEVENTRRRLARQEPIRFRVGLDYGTVTFGNIGSPSRLDFTVLGTPVNTASRLQELCKSLGVDALLAPDVARMSDQPLRAMGRHPIKGLAEPMELHSLGAGDPGQTRVGNPGR